MMVDKLCNKWEASNFFKKISMRISFLIVLFFLTTISLNAGWEVKSPSGLFSGDYQKMCVTEGGKVIWIVGNGGVVACSNDSGLTWKQIPLGITNDLKGVYFLNQSVGWIVGGENPWKSKCDGIILSTTNGGSTWRIQKTSRDIYYDVQFFDRLNGWVVGFDSTYQTENTGVILHTSDGGKNWNRIPTEAGWIWCMHFLNSSSGFIGAHPKGVFGGDIWKTTDGGNNWTSYTLPYFYDNRNVMDIHMSDSLHACCIVPTEGIKYTSDGGVNWNPVLSVKNLGRIVDAGISTWFVTSPNAILKSSNNGVSWDTVFEHPGINDIKDIKFIDANRGLALTARGLILSTSDGGSTWSGIQATVNRFVSPNILSPTSFIIGADGGRIWETSDGGEKWKIDVLPTYSDVYQVTFNTNLLGWVSTQSGLYKTTDGGIAWNLLSPNFLLPFVSFDQSTIIAGSQYIVTGAHGFFYNVGTLQCSFDGGLNWTQMYQRGYSNRPNSICFWNESQGLASFTDYLINSAILIRTQDSGHTWTELPPTSYKDIYSLSLTGNSIAWALAKTPNTNSVQIIKSTNYGYSWYPVLIVSNSLSCLFFNDSYHGWACGNGGVIYRTSDGGVSWDSIYAAPGIDLTAIKFLDNYIGLAIGKNGVLLKTRDGGITFVTETATNLPQRFCLYQNYPNPFNPTTVINYSVPKQGNVMIIVYDALGREVRTLINEEKAAGNYTVEFSAKGGSTSGGNAANLSSGIYYYQIRAGEFIQTKKMILLK